MVAAVRRDKVYSLLFEISILEMEFVAGFGSHTSYTCALASQVAPTISGRAAAISAENMYQKTIRFW